MEEIINEMSNLIYKIAHDFTNDSDLVDELYNQGIIGLYDAYNNYDAKSGTKFSTYAYMYIYGKMYAYLNSNYLIKVNKDTVKTYKLIIKTKEFLEQENKKEPSTKDIAEYLNIDEFIITQTINVMTSPLSLDYEYSDEQTFMSSIKTDDNVRSIYINELLESLNEDERKIILYKYFSGYTQSEIANIMNMSQAGVSRTEKRSIDKMRTRSKEEV